MKSFLLLVLALVALAIAHPQKAQASWPAQAWVVVQPDVVSARVDNFNPAPIRCSGTVTGVRADGFTIFQNFVFPMVTPGTYQFAYVSSGYPIYSPFPFVQGWSQVWCDWF